MFKKYFIATSLLIVFSCSVKLSKASHIAGGEITYTCLGNNQFQINLNLFVDCLGFYPGSVQTIRFYNPCQDTMFTVSINGIDLNPADSNITDAGMGMEISQLCPGQISQSACNGGALPGMWLFSYIDTVTLDPTCDTWTMGWTTCCRNNAITNLDVPSSSTYIQATLNSATAPCNSSPEFTAQPIPYVCVGQAVNYSYGAVETDGDSLYYELTSALGTSDTNNLAYDTASGYSAAQPIPGITIDPITGLLNFIPSTIGNFVVVVKITEYDDNGNIVGTVMRDIQFVVENCNNAVPDPATGTITSFSGNAVQTGPYVIEMCAGNNFNFTATFIDTNSVDTLTFTSNIAAALPGATITQVDTLINPLTLNINWDAPPSSQGQNLTFTITISDGACPIQGQQIYVYNVNILDATTTNPDMTICGPQTAQLEAYGGSIFNWSVISGPPMDSTNFSCNPCANPVASPDSTTTYMVVSNLSGSCKNVDTVTVFVVSDFSFDVSQSATTVCLLEDVQLEVINLNPAVTGYSYLWTPSTYLDNDTLGNPVTNITALGTYNYEVAVTSPLGCVKKDTLTVKTFPRTNAGPDQTICLGSSAQLNASGDGTSYTWSVISGTPITVGTNFSCNNCNNPVTTPDTTTTYMVIGDNGNCLNTDTVTISVAPNFTYDITQSATVICIAQDIQLNVTNINPAGTGFKYLWSPSTFLNDTSIANPLATIPVPGIYTYSVTVASSLGCIKYDSVTITIMPVNMPALTAHSDTAICEGQTANLLLTLGDTPPALCGLSTSGGCTTTTQISVGNGNLSSTYPTPYAGIYSDSRVQIIYTAAELSALGFTGGKITSLAFNIISKNSTMPFNDFTIKMGCTSIADFNEPAANSSFQGSLTAVYGPIATSTALGWNTYNFPTSYLWDGYSNLIVEICYDNSTWSSTDLVEQTSTSNASALWAGNWYSYIPGCDLTSPFPAYYNHPNIRLRTCTMPASPADYVYKWTSSAGSIVNDSIQNTSAQPNTSATYTVTVSDPTGACVETDTLHVDVFPVPVISFTSDTTEGCEPATISFTSTTSEPNGVYSWIFGDGNTSGDPNPINVYQSDSIYDVTLTYTSSLPTACSSTIAQDSFITVYSQPAANYLASPQPTTIVNPIVYFTDQSSGQIDSWKWTFGDLGSSDLQNPYFSYLDVGTYPVQLIVTNTHTCSDTIEGTIIIDPVVTFYAPNAFTPNDNGSNDRFVVKAFGYDYSTFEIGIYNRWGEKVYHSTDIYEGWNGAKNNVGDPQEVGVYVWKVNFKDSDGKKYNYIGHLTLIR